ncbi:methyl-accepting chemotaxis protein [Vitiosangium sp. GDMCC 1.1324]|uniref:methyl-accepting chemotaxis protein n=1 Tax=Vitiosangium sp. (strain GDMCC 1.1324) TaxID=2138576 RepID=UPI000D3C69BC|nr:methyl-accepting chemotaxis protein [Vitiosangium sp. GDMCC 1.1324]PTL84431.1 methyl-accepting chemotaxis protein [Vitiosangium sp. GDMCC 1.1324]
MRPFPPRSLQFRGRLTLAVTLLSLAPLLLLGGLSARLLRKVLTDQVHATLRAETESFSRQLRNTFSERHAGVLSWSEDPILRGALLYGIYTKSNAVLTVLQQRYPAFKAIVLFTPDGRAVSASDLGLQARYAASAESVARSAWFREAFDGSLSGEAALGDDTVLGQRVLRFAVPVIAPTDGRRLGLLMAAYDWGQLEAETQPALERAEAQHHGSLRLALADTQGRLLFGPRNITPLLTPVLAASELDDAGVLELGQDVGGFVRAASGREAGEEWLYVALLSSDEAYAEVRGSLWTSGALVLLFGGLALVGSFLMAQRMVQPIQALNEAVGRIIREGDLTQEISIQGGDEVGQLAASFSEMVRKLREVPRSLQESAQVLTAAVRNLSVSTREQSETINYQAAALQEAQVTAEEIRQTSLVAAQKAEAVLSVVERADDVSRSGSQAIEQSLENLADIRLRAGEIAAKITELSARTLQIGGITQTVTKLADQSNMLALNAAIEAVRSGEHGKGFSVVAREIRGLADQSLKATDRVREILEDISGAIRDTVQITEKGSQRMEAGLERMKASGENLRELSTIVRENVAVVRQISAAVTQQSVGVTQVFAAVSELNKMMHESVARLASTNKATAELEVVAEQMVAIVKSYRV